MKSILDVAKKALSYVGAAGAGQPYSAEDMAVAMQVARPMISELASSDNIYISIHPIDDDSLDVPDELYLPLSMLLAVEIGPDFGTPFDAASREAAVRRIRFIGSTPGYGSTQEAQYF
jgi:hypothetical protein